MAVERFEKQPSEKFAIYGDFSENMADGETLNTGTCTAVDNAGEDVSTDVLAAGSFQYSNQVAQVTVQNGEVSGSPYKITWKMTTSDGWQWELDVKMKIKDS